MRQFIAGRKQVYRKGENGLSQGEKGLSQA
jgi:hypothetical protein